LDLHVRYFRICIIKPEEVIGQLKEKGEKEIEILFMVTVKYKVENEMTTCHNERGLCMYQNERNKRKELM
jgi:hypothetical protein